MEGRTPKWSTALRNGVPHHRSEYRTPKWSTAPQIEVPHTEMEYRTTETAYRQNTRVARGTTGSSRSTFPRERFGRDLTASGTPPRITRRRERLSDRRCR